MQRSPEPFLTRSPKKSKPSSNSYDFAKSRKQSPIGSPRPRIEPHIVSAMGANLPLPRNVYLSIFFVTVRHLPLKCLRKKLALLCDDDTPQMRAAHTPSTWLVSSPTAPLPLLSHSSLRVIAPCSGLDAAISPSSPRPCALSTISG